MVDETQKSRHRGAVGALATLLLLSGCSGGASEEPEETTVYKTVVAEEPEETTIYETVEASNDEAGDIRDLSSDDQREIAMLALEVAWSKSDQETRDNVCVVYQLEPEEVYKVFKDYDGVNVLSRKDVGDFMAKAC